MNGQNHFRLFLIVAVISMFFLLVLVAMSVYTSNELVELIKALLPLLDALGTSP